MAKKLPVDFEKKAKQPPPLDGRGYPYQLSAKDLMLNFKYLLGLMPDGMSKNDIIVYNGADWVIQPAPAATGDFTLQVSDGSMSWSTASTSGLPTGAAGDMLYNNGSEWVLLTAPSAPSAGTVNVLLHSGTVPSWSVYDEVEVDICVSGTPTAYKLIGTAV